MSSETVWFCGLEKIIEIAMVVKKVLFSPVLTKSICAQILHKSEGENPSRERNVRAMEAVVTAMMRWDDEFSLLHMVWCELHVSG